MTRLGFGDIRFEPFGMRADVAVAGGANGGMGIVGLLHHGSEEAGELRQFALKDRLAEVDIAEHARSRVGQMAVRRGVEQRVGVGGEMRRRRDRAGFLGFEMVEERALGQARLGADVLDARGRIAFGADHVDGRVEQLLSRSLRRRRLRRLGRADRCLPIGVHGNMYTDWSVWMSSGKTQTLRRQVHSAPRLERKALIPVQQDPFSR